MCKPDVKEDLNPTEDEIRIGNKFYDVDKLKTFHPGGPLFISAFAGRDATQAFISYHRKQFPHKRVEFALERTEKTVEDIDPNVNADYFELVRRVEKVVPRHKAFAPWTYYIKALVLVAFVLSLEGYIHYTGSYKWYLTGLLGIFLSISALNLTHDAHHGALSSNPVVNRIFGSMQNWYGGCVATWIHQHVVQHHIHTNDIHKDPDISGQRALRLNPLRPLLKQHAFQWLYFFGLFFLYGFSLIKFSFSTATEGFYFTPFSKHLKEYRKVDLVAFWFYYLRWLVLPMIRFPSVWTFLNVLPLFIMFGFYLVFFFHISHNFVGVTQLEDTSPQRSWLYNQVATSSNVAGPILCYINGGLNYQIEHHLFPRMHHGHYPTIAPVVREFCEEKGIPYQHFPTLTANFVSTVDHMYDFGHNVVPEAAKGLDVGQKNK
eukprot:maker-scaffold89_size390429-snap-gene-2.26 protein:Tk12447 transcript:maker-scaffold89_size390429-snap-gene-2.26-mRNA-1 annotation:"delta-4 fatty acid"